jgi:O-antigen/teichoic acid export membrane protein
VPPVAFRNQLKRLGAFGVSVVVSTLVGLIAIPTVIALAGADVWGVLAVAQSIALLLGVLVSFGWGTTGPALVASLPAAERPQFFGDSLVSRLYLFGAALPLVAVVAFLTAGDNVLLTAFACVAYLMPFLGAAWFFVGDGQPLRLLLLDTVPVAVGTLVGLAALYATGEILAYLTCQFVFNVVSVAVSARRILRRTAVPVVLDLHLGRALRRLGGQRHGVITAATSSLYVNTPLIVLSALAPQGVPVYALADRFFKYGLTVLGPVVQVLQGSIPHPDPQIRDARVRATARFAPLGGLIVAGAAAVAIPPASRLFSFGEIAIDYHLSVPVALIFGGVATSQAIGLACLIPIGRGRSLATSTVLGALLGIPLILLGATQSGAVGVAWAVALSEIAVATYQLLVVAAALRDRPSPAREGPEPSSHTR